MPPVSWVPDHVPLPVPVELEVQAVACVEDQVSVDDSLYTTVAGLALSVTLGGGAGCTVTVIDCAVVPPGPVHDSVYVPVVVSNVRVCELAVALFPFHALPTGPLPEHDTASVAVQVSVLDSLYTTVLILALSVTAGGGGGTTGGLTVTRTD